MKLKILALFFVLIIVAACSPTFPLVQDTRLATPTRTPWILGPPGDTATPVPTDVMILPVDTPDPSLVITATLTPDPSLVITPTEEATLEACLIKGNVASGKIYHMPGQANYNQTQVQPENGDKWFCSEQDAIDAGFRKAKR